MAIDLEHLKRRASSQQLKPIASLSAMNLGLSYEIVLYVTIQRVRKKDNDMKTYRVSRENILLTIVIGLLVIAYFLPYYEIGMMRLQYFGIAIGFGLFFFLRAYYKYRFRIELDEQGISVYYQFFRYKHLDWQDIELIKLSQPLWGNPYLYLIYWKNGKRKRLDLKNIITPELVKDIYKHKNLPYSKRIERYLKRAEKKIKPRKFIGRSVGYLLGLCFLVLAIAAIGIYKRTIPYGTGTFENFAYIALIWYVGILITIFAAFFEKRYSSDKSKLIAKRGSLFLLCIFTINQTVFASQEIWFYFTISLVILVSLWLSLIAILKDAQLSVATSKTTYSSAGIIFVILSFSPLLFIPKSSIRYMGTISGEYPTHCSVMWTPDGSNIIVNARPDAEDQYFYFISPTTRKIEKIAMKNEQNKWFSFYFNDINRTFWSPDGSKMITYGSESVGSPQYYLFEHTKKKWTKLKNLCEKNLQNYNFRFYKGLNQPWSPDSRALVISQSRDSTKTTPSVSYLYLYSIQDATKSLLLQSKENISTVFWKRDSTIIYLTYKELGRIIEYNQYHYYQTYTVWKLRPKLDTATGEWENRIQPEKCYPSGELWRHYMFSPSGQYLIVALDSVTTNREKHVVLNTNTFARIPLPGIQEYTGWNRVVWHPAEDRIVYCIDTLERNDIMEFDLKTKVTRKICSENGKIYDISYSSLGDRLVYTVYPKGSGFAGAVVSIKTDGTDWRRVMPSIISANFKAVDVPYAWQPGKDNLAILLAPYKLGNIRPVYIYTAAFR